MVAKRKLPSDLILVGGLTILTDFFVLVPALSGNFIRTVLSFPLVLFLPGYALTTAIFPAKNDLDGMERTALSFGLSIVVVSLIALWMSYTQGGTRFLPMIISLSVFILIICVAAYDRRKQLPEDETFSVPLKTFFLALKTNILEKPERKTEKILKVILILSILASAGALLYIIVSPKEGEHFTEFYILGPKGMADNYHTQYRLGESRAVFVGIVNHEYKPVNYTMEVRIDNKSLFLPKSMRYISLAHNATWEEPVIITPPFEGKGMKLEFLLFNENEKKVPYRSLYLWIDVAKKAGEI